KHFKTLSLDESRSPDFDLFSDQEEYSKEEVAKTMAETMEQYMSQFLKELHDNTFSGSDHEDANIHIEKVLEIVDLFYIPNITIDQVMLRAFPMSLTGAAIRWLRNKPSGSITTWEGPKTKFLSKYCPPACTAKKMEEINNFQQDPDENLYQAWEQFKELLMKCLQHYLTEMHEVVLFYNGLDVPTRQILDSRGAIPSKTAADAKVAIQEMVEYSQKWHNGTSRTRSTETSNGLVAIQAQLNNLRRELKKVNEKVYAAQVGCEQCKGGGYRATALGFYQRNNTNPSYQERRQSMEDILSKFMSESAKRHEENSNLIKEIRASTDAAIRNQGASIKTLEIQIWKMSKVLQERGFRILPSSTETNPRDHVKSISTIVEADSSSIRRMGSSQYAISTGQNHTLIKEKDPGSFTLPCFINNVCFDIAIADLGASVSVMPLSTYLNLGLGELAHTRLTVELADRTVKYPKGIAENVLVGIGKFIFPVDFLILDMPEDIKVPLILGRPFLSLDPFFEDYIELSDLNVSLEFRRDQVDDLMPTIEEGEVVDKFRAKNDARMVCKVFGYPSNCDHDKKIYFVVLEDMDAYRHEGMGDVIFGEPFLREVGINAKWFEGMITIQNGNEEVTYQMVRSHPRFKHHTNEQCNKIPPLLKVSEVDKMNGISHSYQKLKGFYKGVLNLGPDFIREPSMEEWLTRGHISMHDME
ncbi:mitochondrial proton/calcium exchanger protein-like protein isoform X1, partial [Tanacetum coccineum]